MITELKQHHDALIEAVAALEQLVAQPAPEKVALARVRLRLTQCNGRRRALTEAKLFPAIAQLGAEPAAIVRRLRSEEAGMIAASAQHIAEWSIDRIAADWPGYQRASKRITQAIRERVASERRQLYPLLPAVSSSAGSRSETSSRLQPGTAAGTPASLQG